MLLEYNVILTINLQTNNILTCCFGASAIKGALPMVKKKAKTIGELIFGIHPVIELLKAKKRKLISIYTTKPTPKGFKHIEQVLPKYPVPTQYVTRDVLHRMAGTTDHQGVVAWVQPFGYRKKFFDPQKEPFVIMLDGIQDPRNLGAILRSAYCTGVDGVILPKKGTAPLTATAMKASAGLAEHLAIMVVPSVQSAVQELKQAGYTLYLATFDGKDATACEYKLPLCAVIGSEEVGVSSSILQSGVHVTLPQRTEDISYNASVAAGILFFTIAKQKQKI